ncbi:hypothetical protein KI387_013542 [Taxus chinensis]|uniref:Uncharacterized protein n=1 Tax=Taxus chinensis TaxID=29808 RepID=A0AA38FDB4_TAXCH|nr:hypothetical protein KI387_013542 [Taxus chinensis]
MINSVEGPSGNSLGCDNCSATMLQDTETIKLPEGNDEVGISEQLNNNIGKSSEAETPLLTRLNRLDDVLDCLEDRNYMISSGCDPTAPMTENGQSCAGVEMEASEKRVEQRCKPMRWVLEETEAKGTIVERIAALEDRVNKVREDMEVRNICGRDAVIEEQEKQQVRCVVENLHKGFHEELSSRVLHMVDIPKENNNHDENGRNNDKMKNAMVEEEKEEIPTDEKNKKSRSKRSKGNIRRMFVGCIFPHSR